MMPRWRLNASRNIALSAALSTRALNVAGNWPRFGSRRMRVSATGEDLLFLLAAECRPVALDRPVPCERVAHGLFELPKREPGGEHAADVGPQHAGVLVAGEPERQLPPRPNAGVEDRLRVRPDEPGVGAHCGRRSLQQLAERQRLRRTGRVGDAA